MAVMVLVSLLLVLIGILIKHFRAYWLISGYNTMSREKKAAVDTAGLGRFIGNSLFALALVLLSGSLLDRIGVSGALTVSWAVFIVLVAYMLVGSQRYDGNNFDASGRMKLWVKLLIGGIILALLIFAGFILNHGVATM